VLCHSLTLCHNRDYSVVLFIYVFILFLFIHAYILSTISVLSFSFFLSGIFLVFSLGFFLYCLFSFLSCDQLGIFQSCHYCCLLLICFFFFDSSKPKGPHYPKYNCCFLMYDALASDMSLIRLRLVGLRNEGLKQRHLTDTTYRFYT